MKMAATRLLVNDFDKCFEFYSEVMGFEVTWGKKGVGETYGSFKIGEDIGLSIFNAKLMDEHLGIDTDRTKEKIIDQMLLIIAVNCVDKVYEQLKERGVVFLNEPHDVPGWGMRCLHLRDPEGHLIELYAELPKTEWSEDLQNY